MPIDHLISIDKGRTGTIELIVTGLPDLEGLLFKFFAVKTLGDATEIELEGTLDSDTETITFGYDYTTTKDLETGSYYYEIVTYTANKSYIRTVNIGLLKVIDVVQIDPTL
jgi:hypothetical protein